MFDHDKIILKEGTLVDGYNSNFGPYDPVNSGGHVKIGSNSIESGAIEPTSVILTIFKILSQQTTKKEK